MKGLPLAPLGRAVVAHPRAVLLVAALLTAAGLWPAVQVPIHSGHNALLPTDQPEIRRLNAFLEDFGTPSELVVVLEGDPAQVGPAADDVAAAIGKQKDRVAAVFHGLDTDWLLEHAYAFVPPDALDKLASALRKAADAEGELPADLAALVKATARLAGGDAADVPASLPLEHARDAVRVATEFVREWKKWIDDPARDIDHALSDLAARGGRELRGFDTRGRLRSHDGRLVFLFVRPIHTGDELKDIAPVIERVRAVGEQALRAHQAAGHTVRMGLTGVPANIYDEAHTIKRDLGVIGIASGLAVVLIIAVGFRSIRRAILIFVPTLMGAVWGLGFAYFWPGHLTVLTSSFLAILFGMGVDYGIFITGRAEEEEARGLAWPEAVAAAVGSAGRTVIAAGGASTCVFLSLVAVDFPGFQELGVIAAAGVLAVIAGQLAVLPALLIMARPPRAARAAAAPRPWRVPATAVVAVAVLVSVAGGIGWARLTFDYDVLGMLPDGTESATLERRMVAESDLQPEFAVVLARDVAETRALHPRLAKLPAVRETKAPDGTLRAGRVQSLAILFPADLAARAAAARPVADAAKRLKLRVSGIDAATLATDVEAVADAVADAQERVFSTGSKLVADLRALEDVLRDVAARLRAGGRAPERSAAFSAALGRLIGQAWNAVLGWEHARALGVADLPPSLRVRFFGRSGRPVLYVFPRESTYDIAYLDEFMKEVREATQDRVTGFPALHQLFAHMLPRSFRHATIIAGVVALVILALSFRRLKLTLLAAAPLALGALWMTAAMWALGLRQNFASLVSVPLIFAVGLDYGVLFAHRVAEAPGEDPHVIAATVRRAIALAAGTTLAGLGSLGLAGHRGVRTLGFLLTLAIAACWTVTTVLLPAVLSLVRRRAAARGGARGDNGAAAGGGAA